MHQSLDRLRHSLSTTLSSHTNRLLRSASNVPLHEHQREYDQLQPHGVQRLLNDSNLHEVYSKYICRSTYAATLEPMESAWSLFPEVYLDPAFAKMEREKVFKRSWVAIDHRSQHLKEHGDVLSTMIGDVPILITNNNGELKGFYNVCRHRGSILLKEGKYTKCTVIRCPYHSWGYGCNGKLAGAPYFNDDRMPLNAQQKKDKSQVNELTEFRKINFNKEQYGLFEIGVKEFMGTLYVNLDDDIERRESLFQHQMGDLPAHYGHYPWSNMAVVAQNEYRIEANWKLVAENFIEYYHLPWVHPELCQVSSVANHIRRQGTGHYMGFATYPLSYGGTPSDPDAFDPFAGINDVEKEAAWFIQVFPNISYWIFPHNVVTLITSPTDDPGVTTEKFTVMMDQNIKNNMESDENLRAKIKELVDFYVLTNNQDIAAVESVQRGLQCLNAYRGGRLSAKFEEPVYRFQQCLIDYMTDQCMDVRHGDADFVHSQYLKKGKQQTH